MKRRKLLKNVGSATGAAALSAPKILAQTKSSQKTASQKPTKKGSKTHSQTNTYGLASISSADPQTPFSLPVRMPGWFPDGADLGQRHRQRLFPEEVIGRKKSGYYESFPVHFLDNNEDSKKWILGSKLVRTKHAPDGEKPLTRFVRRLALRIRQYNASLYRLRRLHFYWDYKDKAHPVIWPPPNPVESHPSIPDPSDLIGFSNLVKEAETDWSKVCDQVNGLLEEASGDNSSYKVKLLAADMVAVNGYVVSMRVVVQKPGAGKQSIRPVSGPVALREPGVSSSHVSISSAFSSSSQIINP